MNSISDFVIIDDDTLSNQLCKIAIKTFLKNCEIKLFTNPLHGLEYITNNSIIDNKLPTIILLDINMPLMNGWEFLNLFDKLEDKVKSYYKVYIISSSVSVVDKELAQSNHNIVDYISKPLTSEIILSITSI